MKLRGQPALDVKTPVRRISAVSIYSVPFFDAKTNLYPGLGIKLKSKTLLKCLAKTMLLSVIFTQTTFYFFAFCDILTVSRPVENYKLKNN